MRTRLLAVLLIAAALVTGICLLSRARSTRDAGTDERRLIFETRRAGTVRAGEELTLDLR